MIRRYYKTIRAQAEDESYDADPDEDPKEIQSP